MVMRSAFLPCAPLPLRFHVFAILSFVSEIES